MISKLLRRGDDLGAAMVYALGLASMMVIDLSVASLPDSRKVASWALLKSVLFIGSPLVLLGIDHALVRSPDLLRKAAPLVAVQAIILSFGVGVGVQLILGDPWPGTAAGVLAVAATSFLFAALRARSHLGWAQVALQGWKQVLVVIILFRIWNGAESVTPSRMLVVVGCLATLVLVSTIGRAPSLLGQRTNLTNMEGSIRDLYRAGTPFVATMVLLNLSLFVEQLLLNAQGSVEESARLFSHTSVVLPLIVFGNGFVNFWLGSQARRNGQGFVNRWNRFKGLIPVWSGLSALFGLLLGWQVVVTSPIAQFHFEWKIAIALAVVGALRTSFVVPSSYIAVWAEPSELHRFVRVNALGFAGFIAVFIVLVVLDVSVIAAVLAGSLTNWTVRVFSAYSTFLPVVRRDAFLADDANQA